MKSIAGIYYPLLFADNFVGIDFNPNYYVDNLIVSSNFSNKKKEFSIPKLLKISNPKANTL